MKENVFIFFDFCYFNCNSTSNKNKKINNINSGKGFENLIRQKLKFTLL